MANEYKEKTTFVISWRTFCYKVMSFELKNVGATNKKSNDNSVPLHGA